MHDILAKEFKPKRIIDNPSEEKLREWALEQGGVITEFGNLSVVTTVRNRIAKFTEVAREDSWLYTLRFPDTYRREVKRILLESL
ncbi:unnamed protein product [marine sediment metagenome]|uniref:Uncharacterized protein n=1 Tax=marine sediment metagenome TaxID=412755 RepID=X1PFY6_9ZZZZ